MYDTSVARRPLYVQRKGPHNLQLHGRKVSCFCPRHSVLVSLQSFQTFVSDKEERERFFCKSVFLLIGRQARSRPPPPASRSCARVLPAASRRALNICRGCRPPRLAASSPYGRRSPYGEGGIRGLGALWSTAHCCIMLEDTFGKHDQQLGVELMRMYCDPRGDCAWCPKWGVKSPSPAPAMQPDQRALSSPPGWTFRRYLRQRLGAGRLHDRRSCWRSI